MTILLNTWREFPYGSRPESTGLPLNLQYQGPAVAVVEKGLEHWKQIEGLPETTLLRLVLLKKTAHKLHSEKSRLLATDQENEAKAAQEWENRLTLLRNCKSLLGPWEKLIEQNPLSETRLAELPESLILQLRPGQLPRSDRMWEQSIAAEAVSVGWKFWTLDAWVQIAQIEKWDATLQQVLWPQGLVLFSDGSNVNQQENLRQEPSQKGSKDQPGQSNSIWHGKWLTALHPKADPTQFTLELQEWPGTSHAAPSDPLWKCIYPNRGSIQN